MQTVSYAEGITGPFLSTFLWYLPFQSRSGASEKQFNIYVLSQTDAFIEKLQQKWKPLHIKIT